MSDDWDVYFTLVEEKPAAMLVDLGLGPEAPIPGLSVLCYVTVDLAEPDENGMSGAAEHDALMRLEDALVAAVTNETSVFVGVSTVDGRREFFFYMDNAKGVEERVEAVMASFEEYVWDMGLVEEPGWETFLDFLYPDEREMDGIWNSRMRRNLEAQDDDLARARDIVHTIRFQGLADMDAFAGEAKGEGFRVTSRTVGPDNTVEALVCRKDVPEELDSVTWALRELAGAHGGEYEGWDCAAGKEV